MNFDFITIVSMISGLIAIFLAVKVVKDIRSFRKQQPPAINVVQVECLNSEYQKILDSTYWLEHERQSNQGEHFEDESVYLNRAQIIRENTSFFSLVNE
jgi:hypothetical protein